MPLRRRHRLCTRLLLLAVLLLPFWLPPAGYAAGGAETPSSAGWEAEFEALCARTPEVMSLSREELQRLLADCDRLQPQVEALPESPRKVYRKRLERARNLFLFTLEAKDHPPQQ
jgi:hypothetical protein